MNLLKIIDDLNLENVDQDEFLKPALRRGLFKKASEFSLKAAMASLPIAMMAMPRIAKANGQDALSILNYALKLEYLEKEFYTLGLASTSTVGFGSYRPVFEQIKKHEVEHVDAITNLIKALGGTPVAKPTFDFTGAKGTGAPGPFADVFSNFSTFLALSQAFEDTGVRAYKGKAADLISPSDTLTGLTAGLTVALQIHSVEARHASIVRRIRRKNLESGAGAAKGWITQKNLEGLPLAAAGVYGAGSDANMFPAEDNKTQGGVNLGTALVLPAGVTQNHITEAFDEPLDEATVLSIAGLFIV
ncbi:MAG: ferritin-like domain-containing protein [Opitutaceae bacterium]|nr:ferritin-like domain-containing protein [Cytophagales bacterium]